MSETKVKTSTGKGLGIAGKVLIPIAGIVIFIFFSAIISVIVARSIENKLTIIGQEKLLAMEAAEQIRYDVINTAEIFTDASATHDTEPIEEAKDIKADFEMRVQEIKQYDSKDSGGWDNILAQYNQFYDLCEKMANTYISSGLDAGNEIMEQVDPVTESLSEAVDDEVLEMEEDLENEIQQVLTISFTMVNISLITSVINLLIALYIAFVVVKRLITPVKKINTSIQSLADCDLTVEELNIKQKDEIGNLANSFNFLRNCMREMVENLGRSTTSLEDMSSTMFENSDAILKNVTEVTAAINNITEVAGEQAADVESSMHELEGLKEIATQNSKTSDNLSEASAKISVASKEGNQVLDGLYNITKESEHAFKEIFDSIEQIKFSTVKIGEASSMIENIAAQTNLLSLNASIEAARAGEMGRGFAVVADEIRKLSDESTSSVNEINHMLQELEINVDNATRQSENVQEAVKKQVLGVEDTRSSYDSISENLQVINSEIVSLAEVSKSMTDSCKTVGFAMEHLASAAEENAAATEETNASIEEVLAMTEKISSGSKDIKDNADELNQLMKRYRI